MGAADIATVLFTQFLKIDPADPKWPDRDRFVLSAGHGSMLLYALIYLLGSETMTIDQIKRFRQLGSLTPGHPENFVTPGIETTTGPLGQGLGNAVGMAIAERHLAAQFGDIVDHRTYVLCSDGDLMEGISHEAIALAGHLKLNRLVVLFDDNGISIDGPLSLADSVDQVKRFEAAGWAASRIDGHDPQAIAAALVAAKKSDKPTMIACKTTIGFGAPTRPASRRHTARRLARKKSRARARSSAGPCRRSRYRRTSSSSGAMPENARKACIGPGMIAWPRYRPTSAPSSSAARTAICRRGLAMPCVA
jgi:transketolase